MARSKKEAGQAYLDGILKLVPEAEREAVKKALTADTIAEAAGEGVLMRDDYSRLMDEVKGNQEKVVAYYNQLNGWYQEKAQDLQKGEEALTELQKLRGTPPADKGEGKQPPAFDTSQFLSREEAGKMLAQSLQNQAVNVSDYLTFLTNLGLKHQAEFGKPLDLVAFDQRARKENKRLDTLYDEVTKDAREAKIAEAAKKHEEELRTSIRQEIEDEFRKRPQMPYPIGGEGMGDPNATLAGLNGETKEKAFGTQAAVDEFYRMRRSQ